MWATHRRWRSYALHWASWREPRGQSGAHQLGAAADGQDASESRRSAEEVFDGLQEQLARNRTQFYIDLPTGPFYGYNRPGAKPSQAIIQNWWRQGMMGGAKAHYDGIVAFSRPTSRKILRSSPCLHW